MGELVYIDEYRRKDWLRRLEIARETGSIAVFNAMQETDAVIIDFPTKGEASE